MRKEIVGVLFISFAAVLWGLDGVALTPRLFNLDVALVVFLLHAIPFIILSVIFFREYKKLLKFTAYDYLVFFLIALFGGSLGTLAIVKALFLVKFNGLSVVVLLQKLQPVFAIALAGLLLKEKIRKDFMLWAGIAVVASYFLAFQFHIPSFQKDSEQIQAVFWAIVAAFSFGSATVFGKMALRRHSFVTANFYRFGFTAVLMFFYVLLLGKLGGIALATPMNWVLLVVIAFTTGSGAILIYYYGLKRVSAHVSTICELFYPLSAVFFDFVLNGKVLSPIQAISSIVLVGVIIHISRTESG